MVVRTFSKALFLTLLACSARAGIDFTPAVSEYTSQGFVYRRVTLQQRDGAAIHYVPPQGWSVRGDQASLQVLPPNETFAEGAITAKPLAAPAPFDEATVGALEQQVIGALPPGSQSAQVLSRESNPVLIGDSTSYGFVVEYAALGKKFERTVIFVRTATAEITFRLSAPKAAFDRLNAAFRGSIASWQ
jgi:hypothetical protein